MTLSPGFWDDNKRATEILKSTKLNEYWVNLYEETNTAVEDFAVLFEFWKGGDATEDETKEAYQKAIDKIEEAEFKSTLNEPEDELPAVLQINSGAGGTESQDWAEILARMYRMYGEKQGWKQRKWIGRMVMVPVSKAVPISLKATSLTDSLNLKVVFTAWLEFHLSIATPVVILLSHLSMYTHWWMILSISKSIRPM